MSSNPYNWSNKKNTLMSIKSPITAAVTGSVTSRDTPELSNNGIALSSNLGNGIKILAA